MHYYLYPTQRLIQQRYTAMQFTALLSHDAGMNINWIHRYGLGSSYPKQESKRK